VKNRLLLLGFVLSTLQLSAQKGFEIGGWLGAGWYVGDINPTISVQQAGAALGIVTKRNFNTRISLSQSISYIRLRGDDALSTNQYQQQRNLNFVSNVIEWSPYLEFNFFEYIHGSSTQYYTPYAYAGFNVLRHNPKSTHNNTKTELQPLGTEGQVGPSRYSRITGGLSYGFGMKYDINRDWSINAAINGRKTFTDYLDDVSTVYPSYAQLQADQGAEAVYYSNPSEVDGFGAEGTQRGDSKNTDNYYFVSVSFLRYFGKLECPSISTIRQN
jgi:hypothetical protein